MLNLKKLLIHFREVHKYFLIGFLGVVIIYGVNLLGVEFFKLRAELTYFIATILNYIISFFGNAAIFNKKPDGDNLGRFVINSLFFLILNNLFFVFLVRFLNLNYALAITANFIIFPVSKFLSYKYLVFKVNYE